MWVAIVGWCRGLDEDLYLFCEPSLISFHHDMTGPNFRR
jgi:hypothetical protein